MRQTDVPSQDARQRSPNLPGVQPDIAQFAAVRHALRNTRRISTLDKGPPSPGMTRLPIPLRMLNYSVFQKSTAATIGKIQNKIIPEHARERLIIVNDSIIQFSFTIFVSYGLVPQTGNDLLRTAPIDIISSNSTPGATMVFEEPRSGNYLQDAAAINYRSQSIGGTVSQDQICVSWISFVVGDVIDIKIFEGFRA